MFGASEPGPSWSRARSRRTSTSASAPSRSGRTSVPGTWVNASRRRRAPVKAVLLDQRALAGVGNIYADEALWRAKVHPLTPADALGPAEVKALHRAVRKRARTGTRPAGLDAPRLPAPGRRQRRDAARVQGLRPRRRAVRPLRHADRQDPRRGSGHLVLPELPGPPAALDWSRRMAGRTSRSQVVVLRSIRYGEADRILHLYSAEHGRIGAIAKGVRKTKSRFGARLEPLSHVELMLHHGAGELHTITGVDLIRSHHTIREEPYRLNVGLIGAEAMLRLHGEPEANERAFGALTRFLDVLDDVEPSHRPPGARPARPVVPAEAAVALGLPAARDQLRRMRRDRRARRLLGARGRRRLPGARRRRAAPVARGARRDRAAADRRRSSTRTAPACPSGHAATPSPS